jgi:hypothetical protein
MFGIEPTAPRIIRVLKYGNSWPEQLRHLFKTLNQSSSLKWWLTPVIPAIRKAETEGARIGGLPGNIERPHLKKNNTKYDQCPRSQQLCCVL